MEIVVLNGKNVMLRGKRVIMNKNPHFIDQNSYILNSAKLFRLDDIDNAANYIGLSLPLPIINENTNNDKPILTDDQKNMVNSYYATDWTIFSSITDGGYDFSWQSYQR